MSRYSDLCRALESRPLRWLVTGGAGFIGSHVVAKLLSLGQKVRVLDDLSTGKTANLAAADPQEVVELLHGNLCDGSICLRAVQGMDRIIHLAAMGSVPLSLSDPFLCHEVNSTGTFQLFMAAVSAQVPRVVYASSSAVYGDDPLPQKVEESIGRSLSPYAASKRINEIHAQTLNTCFGLEAVGLRYFNVFGPRQDPKGAYAAVIPQWIAAMKNGLPVYINGDGSSSRDFCYVSDVVQANLLAAMTNEPLAFGNVFNVGLGQATSLNQLFAQLQSLVQEQTGRTVPYAIHREFREGDILHSCADATKAGELLGFQPEHEVLQGLRETVASV
jgi:UDP-N-acetylglucosamine/UDP-N-acetylgalactosamine 4-epimerase